MDTEDFRKGFLNLYDAFLNAHLQRSAMLRSPVDTDDPFDFLSSDRGRLERTYVTFLYVLVEAWEAPANSEARREIQARVSHEHLTNVLRKMRRSGLLESMREIRDYMCHRDKRELWDPGRIAVAGWFKAIDELYMAFSEVMLAARQTIPPPRRDSEN